ncbi:ROK family protein [Abyssisolibacter fermentans]|uniref:ROK family protein n=1 Tax=Abyssisolibacter fermentans TaxID=1766203 RepID=UPI0008364BEA|nr:ROK family protein [Abyssisolibacter fermentans]
MKKINKGANQISLKHLNQTLIIDKIKNSKAISRAELSKNIGLSAPSISKNIEELLDKGIILETGIGESKGGRRPIVLAYNYDYGHIIGIALKEDSITVIISNLSGEVINEYNLEGNLTKTEEQDILIMINESISKIMEESKIQLDSLKCIVLSLPGIIDDNSVKVSNIFPCLQGKVIVDSIMKRFNTKVIIKNDINTRAIGEYWKLPENDLKNFIYISPEKTGVGAGVILNGKLFEGSSFGAGEVGYMLLNTEFLANDFSKNDIKYLEKIISKENVFKYAYDLAIKNGGYIRERVKDDQNNINLKILVEAIKQEDEVGLKVMEFLSRYFAITVHNIATILNPDVIVLGGMIKQIGNPIYDSIKKYLEKISIIPIDIRLANFNDISQLYGCIYFGIKYIDENILNL